MNKDPITWERLRAIFGNAGPVRNVTERQFDYNDLELQKLAQTPYEAIDFDDLCYYHHDLAYVELQREVFDYLFPVCLMDWHRTLLANQACSHGDSEFHYGIVHGNVLEKMMTAAQRAAVYDVFHDSMLFRFDQERGFIYAGIRTPAYGWMGRMNSLAQFMETLPKLWERWWKLETPGRAVAALQYCSGLLYEDGANPIFQKWTPTEGGGGPYLWANGSYVFDRGWTERNLVFAKEFLTVSRIAATVQLAANVLASEPEAALAARIAADLPDSATLLELRVSELPLLLESPDSEGWTI